MFFPHIDQEDHAKKALLIDGGVLDAVKGMIKDIMSKKLELSKLHEFCFA